MKDGGKWCWHFAGELARAAVGDYPEERFAGAEPVKVNDRRKVLTDGKFFFKLENRRGRGFAAEFRRGLELEKAGVPVVQHLAYGTSEAGGALITLAETGAVDAAAYLLANPRPDGDFADRLAEFTGMLCRSPFFHGDCHLGNLLWIPGERSFKLVDVRAVRRRPFFFRQSNLLRMYRLITELRTFMKRPELYRLLECAGAADPQKLFREILRRDAAALRREWKRRSEQILSGYPKFTRREGDMLISAGCAAGSLAEAEKEPGGTAVMLASFFLDLARIPHRQVLACDTAAGEVFFAGRPSPAEPSPELLADYMERLAVFGISTAAEDWAADPAVCGIPRLINFNPVIDRI